MTKVAQEIGLAHWTAIAIAAMPACLVIKAGGEESTFVYAVQISAVIQSSPPQITLQWEPDPYGAISYTIYRKAETDNSWGVGMILSGSVTNYTDTNVVAGAAYEYQIVKAGALGYTGYGYIYSGINAPLIEGRGTVLMIVATNSTVGLDDELARLQTDLTGDGWLVIRHDVSSNDTPANVKALITSDYNADPANVNATFLFGHVPILESGNLNYDGHQTRPMPADAYYGDVDDDWPTDPAISPSFLPSDVELMIGRVDFANMPGNGAVVPWPSETDLLRNYLNKDHAWRHKLLTVPRQALMGNRRGDEQGLATAASGYRNFEPLVGPQHTIEANAEDNATPEERWMSMLARDRYLWAYGCGGGQPTGISELGTNGLYNDVWSLDVVGQDAKAVFVMVFGSWFGNWDDTDDIMRSFLATPTMGLTACMAGQPHWFMHHMGLGEPIGFSTRLTMNNSSLYRNESNEFTRAVYIALMGDPTLRMDAVAPPSEMIALQSGNVVTLNWSSSPDPVSGYHVYRAVSDAGPFTRRTTSPLTTTNFTDTAVPPGTYTYMVRAISLQTTPSGTYFNPSQGIFSKLTVIPIPTVQVQATANGVLLSWNSVSNASYHVQACSNLSQANWIDLSGAIYAEGTITSWTDSSVQGTPGRCYRISSP